MKPELPTQDVQYTQRLLQNESVWWKRLFDVQAPYRMHLRHLKLRHTLDVGCGVGRNLLHLHGNGVGVDHNPASIEEARRRGLIAYTVEDFLSASSTMMDDFPGSGHFDSILVSHVMEHMSEDQGAELITCYLRFLKPQGRVVLITPQEAGYRSDPTHVEFFDLSSAQRISKTLGLPILKQYSFPFPRFFGYFFKYNEFVTILQKP